MLSPKQETVNSETVISNPVLCSIEDSQTVPLWNLFISP